MGVDSEKTKEYRELNEHIGVRNSDDHIFQERRDLTLSNGKGRRQAFPNSQTPLDSDLLRNAVGLMTIIALDSLSMISKLVIMMTETGCTCSA